MTTTLKGAAADPVLAQQMVYPSAAAVRVDPADRSGSARTMRDARGRVRDEAAAGDDAAIAAALHLLVDAAVSAGFARVTICSIAAAALEEGLAARPALPGRRRRQHVATWETWVRARYAELSGEAGSGS
jgi:hypothetical protein